MSNRNTPGVENATVASVVTLSLLDALQASGAFASSELQQRSVKLGKQSADVFVRELPDAEFRQKVGAPYNRANLIAACICDADGKPVMSAEQAAALKVNVARDLERICFEVNGAGEQSDSDERAGKS